MNRTEYQRAYQFVRATMEANDSDLDYSTATCPYREACSERDIRFCYCDHDAYIYQLRRQAIAKISEKGITDKAIQIATDGYSRLRRQTPKEIALAVLQRRLKVASNQKLWRRGK